MPEMPAATMSTCLRCPLLQNSVLHRPERTGPADPCWAIWKQEPAYILSLCVTMMQNLLTQDVRTMEVFVCLFVLFCFCVVV
ncbi:hypothetical protein LEMLEM_LOCUS9638 [Lemmus lemmus]